MIFRSGMRKREHIEQILNGYEKVVYGLWKRNLGLGKKFYAWLRW